MSLIATVSSPITSPCLVQSQDRYLKPQKNVQAPVRVKPLCLQFHSLERQRIITHSSRIKRASVICAAALSATCASEQTQTVTRQSSTITVAPIQGKEKSPDLDDGGDGFPPRDDGDGGGGGGGGGGNWSGGFFFFGFLAFLGFLKDQESEGTYRDERRR
ncbi:protein YELLOW LEAF 1, choloroplastic-like [Salvia splendens]|uniref:protein YELLOW LEAF 1, choloroplastic-like n=1 Tax=Salvia splendens TaxID=180675 RepID=UPI001C26158D|nr:protein YELLOW LEAF 1, choloroplastic-like [Salvia splendens]